MLHTPTNQMVTVSRDGHGTDASPQASLRRWFDRVGASATYEAGTTLFAAGEAARSVYLVRAGTVRLCTFTEDGCRQIVGFARAGEMLGHAEPGEWHLAAEAIDRVEVGCVSLARFERAVAADERLRAGLRQVCAEQIAERDRHLAWLAHLPAEARLLAFLEEFEAGAGEGIRFTTLPMTRREIGDHLGMSLETVSRAFGALQRKGRIETRGSARYRTRPAAPAMATSPPVPRAAPIASAPAKPRN